MTGEITLGGFVLPVGGIKEKTMAARRSGVKTLVFPAGNKKDVEVSLYCADLIGGPRASRFVCVCVCVIQELPTHLVEGLDIHFANTYSDVYKVAFDSS